MIFLGSAIVLTAVIMMVTYNGLVRSRNRVDNALSQIDVQLRRRLDLIPALVATVQGYCAHEKETLVAATEARRAALAATPTDVTAAQLAVLTPARLLAENALALAMPRLLALAESYPDLKADRHFLQLQEELVSTENRIAFARQFHNDTVLIYNTSVESFPVNFVASPLGFLSRPLFTAPLEASLAPRIQMGDTSAA